MTMATAAGWARPRSTATAARSFTVRSTRRTPVPAALPEVVWRAGLDLAPIDVTDEESVAWLESLVWPGERDRIGPLRAAVARRPRRSAARGRGRPAHRPGRRWPSRRRRTRRSLSSTPRCSATCATRRTAGDFADTVRSLGARWVANEPPGVVELEQPPRPGPAPGGEILLSLDAEPLGWADPHGAWLRWIG